MIQDIEKFIIADRICSDLWNQYCEMIPALKEKNILKPSLDAYAKAVRSAGTAWRWQHRIWINTAYFDGSETSINHFTETIAHELAHCIQWKLFPDEKQAHGPGFRFVMQSIGYRGDTYHRMSVSKAASIAAKHKDELFNLD